MTQPTRAIRIDPADVGRATPPRKRRVIGLRVSSRFQTISAALVNCEGAGFNAKIDVLASNIRDIPPEVVSLHDRIVRPAADPRLPHAVFAAEIAECQAAMVHQLLSQARLDPNQILVLGIVEPGQWDEDANEQRSWLSLCDAARLAETTGLSVVDALPARDVAQGGRGGPLAVLPLLILFSGWQRIQRSAWVVIELSESVQVTYFSTAHPREEARILMRTVEPGLSLIDDLARQTTSGRQACDVGGRLAVQGRKLSDLLDDWKAHRYFANPPAWNPTFASQKEFLQAAVGRPVHARRSLQDVLCTATHLVADGIKQAVEQRLPQDPPIAHAVLLGGGCQNGMLLREIAVRLPNCTLLKAEDFGLKNQTVPGALAAILALLHVDHVAGNLPDITGAETPRVLGRLTPGTPVHWRRLLMEMVANKPQMLTLRNAM